jgi:hypothetical protein
MSESVPLWLQIITIVVAPLLALAGVGLGVRLSRTAEDRQWLRDSRLRSYKRYLLACNKYEVASHQLEASLAAGQRADQAAARDAALRAIGEVIARQESVLLLGSSEVRQACTAVTDAVYARNEQARRLLEGTPSADASDQGQELRRAIDALREAVRAELASR